MSFGPEQQRKLLELSFEPSSGGYLYYRNRWARGVPVTAEERDSYLSASVLGSRGAFYTAIRGRAATAPPRKFGPVYWKILSRMPVAMGGVALFFGVALASDWFAAGPILGRAVLVILGIVLVVFGAQVIYARVAVRPRQ